MKLFLIIFSAIIAAAMVIWAAISVEQARKHHEELMHLSQEVKEEQAEMYANATNSTAPAPGPQ